MHAGARDIITFEVGRLKSIRSTRMNVGHLTPAEKVLKPSVHDDLRSAKAFRQTKRYTQARTKIRHWNQLCAYVLFGRYLKKETKRDGPSRCCCGRLCRVLLV